MKVLSLIRSCIPPIAYDIKKRIRLKEQLYYTRGRFNSWHEALKESNRLGGDYSDISIIDRVDAATQKVRNGEALYEQDGVCFYIENKNWELLSALFYVKAVLGKVSVLDFGGALGSTFFRYKNLIDDIDADWCIVERETYVARGKNTVPELRFFYSIDEALSSGETPNVLLLSSVLMYLDNPFRYFEDMLKKGFDYVIIDESAFFKDEKANTEIMIEHVPARIYKAVYPLHVFGLHEFRSVIEECDYEIQWEWVYRGGQIPIKKGIRFIETIDKGFLLRKKTE